MVRGGVSKSSHVRGVVYILGPLPSEYVTLSIVDCIHQTCLMNMSTISFL